MQQEEAGRLAAEAEARSEEERVRQQRAQEALARSEATKITDLGAYDTLSRPTSLANGSLRMRGSVMEMMAGQSFLELLQDDEVDSEERFALRDKVWRDERVAVV